MNAKTGLSGVPAFACILNGICPKTKVHRVIANLFQHDRTNRQPHLERLRRPSNPLSSKEAGTFSYKGDSFSTEKLCGIQKTGTFFEWQIPLSSKEAGTFFNYQFTEMILIDLNLYILSIKFFLSAYLRVSDLEPLCSLSLR